MQRSSLFWIRTASLAFVFTFVSVFFTSPVLAQSLPDDPCPLEIGTPYRTQSISTVYVVTEGCEKRPIFNPDVYFSHFASWDEVTFVASSDLNLVPDHPLNFLPWGPLRTFGNGSLIKIVSDPRVYLIQNGRAYPIESEEAFLSIGYAFNQIEDVTEDVLSSFLIATTIRGPEDVPAGLVFKYANDPSVYILVEENGELKKRHIETMEELEAIYRGDRLAILPTTSVFANSAGSNVSSIPKTVIKNYYPNIPATPTTEDSTPAPDTTAPSISSVASSTGETTATITWTTDESSTSTVEYGETDSYGSTSSSVAFTTSHSIVIDSLTADTTYHFRVSSSDDDGNLSTSADYTFLTTADTTAPVISSVASSTGETTATITWTTNESSTSTVEYGETDSYGSTTSSVAFTTSHSIVIESLTADTVYHFRVSSSDDDGNLSTSADYTFLTTADTTAPVISSVASSTGETTATITWTTNESATSTVEYGTTDSYGSTSSSVAFTTSHSIVIESLTADTTYHFRVSSSDDDGNLSTSADYTFLTTADVTAPVISSVASSTGETTATITWTTNESATSTVEYGTTDSYGSTSSSVAFTTSHSIVIESLTADTTYHFRVSSSDDDGNRATSTDYTFLTDPDTTAPIISSVASSTTDTTITITWTTDEAATSTVEYGETDSYGSTSSSVALETSHSIVIEGLTSLTAYHFRISSQDAAGNVATSTDYRFSTLGDVYWADDFNRADGAPGNGWDTPGSATAEIVSNALRRTDSAGYQIYYNPTDVTLPADYVVTATVPHSMLSTSFWGIASRVLYTEYGIRMLFTNPTTITVGQLIAWDAENVTVKVTGGFPASWSVDQNHTVGIKIVGTSGSILLDGEEYGTFTMDANNQTGTGVAIVGDGNNRDWFDIQVTDYIPSPDNTAPVISSVASSTTDTTATITWTTDESATSTVEYGTTDSYGSTTSTVALGTSHSIVIEGLSSNTTYHFRVSSQDAVGNTATSSDSTFITAGHVYWADYFNRADGAPGNGWLAEDTATAEIVNNALRRTDSAGYRVYYNPTDVTLPRDYVVTATIPHSTLSTNYWGIASRWSGDTGVRLFFVSSVVYVGNASGWADGNVTVTETGGFPASWSIDQNHTMSVKMVGSGGTVYLDGSEYGTFTLATNATLDGTGVAIVGEGNNRDWYDIRVTDYVPGLDETEPVISSVASSTTEATALITWNTDDFTDATVEYGTTDSYGSTSSSAAFGTTHSISLMGLSAETDYYFRVISQNAAGSSTSAGYTFRTLADTSGPIIYSVASSTASSTTVVITWDTNENATSTVEYGLTDSYGSTSSTLALTTSHSIVIDDLTPDTLYHFRVSSQDATGKTTTSGDYTFHTVLWADLFERADGATGNGWAAYAVAASEIVSNALRMTHGTSYGVMYNMTNTTLPADYTITATVPHNTLATPYWGITSRWDSDNGVRLIFGSPSTNVYAGQASAWDTGNVTITVTGGFPASWSAYQPTHTIAIKMSGTSGSIILDGEEYGTFTLDLNNQTGTGVGIVGEGRNRDWYDIVVTSD